MAVSYDKVMDLMFKLFAHSCAVTVIKDGQAVIVKNYLLIAYQLFICLCIIATSLTRCGACAGNVITLFQTFLLICQYYSLVISILSTILHDVKYKTLLRDITVLTKKLNPQRKRQHRIVLWLILMFSCHLTTTFLNTFSPFQGDGISCVVTMMNISFLFYAASFSKIFHLIVEFTGLIRELNLQTRKHLFCPPKLKLICVYYMDFQEVFEDVNVKLNPLLIINLMANFVTLFTQPYMTVKVLSFSRRVMIYSLTIQCLGEWIKLILISIICDHLNFEFAEWWRIVELTPGSPYLLEFDSRGLTCCKKREPTISVYNLIDIDKTYLPSVTLTILSYAFLVMQTEPNFNEYIKNLQ